MAGRVGLAKALKLAVIGVPVLFTKTNMSTSYSAGRWAQLHDPDLLKIKPYFTYRHADGVRHPRPHHLSWNGITLPHDDIFWQTHSCPNGWLCHCRIESASARDFHSAQADGKGVKPDRWDKIDAKTGEPVGIDKGFGYAPGASLHKQLQGFVDEKVKALPAALGKALQEDLRSVSKTTPRVSESLTLPKKGIAKEASRITLAEIDKLHSVKGLPNIPVKNSTTQKFQGSYSYRAAQGTAVDIKISTASVNPELTLAHEIGHFIDHQALGNTGTYGSLSHEMFAKWRIAIESSDAT